MRTKTLVGIRKKAYHGVLLWSAAALALLSSCASAPAKPIEQILTETPTATAAYTPSPSPTLTATPEPLYSLSGVVFFDYNGSGLQDIAYNMDGEAIEEPGIADVPVCLDQNPETEGIDGCVLTAADGSYSITGIEVSGMGHHIYVKSPSDEPAEAFRYINKWKGPVVIPAYEMNGVQVPEQHLNDTEVIPIDQSLYINLQGDLEQNIALIQGFLTLPFVQEQVGKMPFIFNYFDIIGIRLFDSKNNFFNTQDGLMLNYNGEHDKIFFPGPFVYNATSKVGVSDSHNGLDFYIDKGNYVVVAGPTSSILSLPIEGQERLLQSTFSNPTKDYSNNFVNTYGHLSVTLVDLNQKVYRGQIIALSGDSHIGGSVGGTPLLHFDIFNHSNKGSYHYDPFRYTVILEEKPKNFWGSEESLWTFDNQPTFP